MSRVIHREAIMVDDQWHTLEMTGPILHVACRGEDYIEFWHLHDPDVPGVARAFRVVETGLPLAPALAHHIGSAVTPSGRHVWHLMEHQRVSDG